MKLEHILIPYTKIKLKWLKDLNIRHNTIKLLEENIAKTFSDINPTNISVFQGDRNKSKKKKKKKNPPPQPPQTLKTNCHLIKPINACTAKEIINKTKRQSMD